MGSNLSLSGSRLGVRHARPMMASQIRFNSTTTTTAAPKKSFSKWAMTKAVVKYGLLGSVAYGIYGMYLYVIREITWI